MVFTDDAWGTIVAFSMMTSSWVRVPMPKLGTGGNAMADDMDAMLDCMVEGLGVVAPVPPPGVALRGHTSLAATRVHASWAVQLCHCPNSRCWA